MSCRARQRNRAKEGKASQAQVSMPGTGEAQGSAKRCTLSPSMGRGREGSPKWQSGDGVPTAEDPWATGQREVGGQEGQPAA